MTKNQNLVLRVEPEMKEFVRRKSDELSISEGEYLRRVLSALMNK